MQEKKKLIKLSICFFKYRNFYNQLMDEKVLRMVERILTDNRVVFIMGTNRSYDNQISLTGSIFFPFEITF